MKPEGVGFVWGQPRSRKNQSGHVGTAASTVPPSAARRDVCTPRRLNFYSQHSRFGAEQGSVRREIDSVQLTFSGGRAIPIGIDAPIFPPKYFVRASNSFSMSTPVSGCCRPSRCVTSAICAKCSTVSIFM